MTINFDIDEFSTILDGISIIWDTYSDLMLSFLQNALFPKCIIDFWGLLYENVCEIEELFITPCFLVLTYDSFNFKGLHSTFLWGIIQLFKGNSFPKVELCDCYLTTSFYFLTDWTLFCSKWVSKDFDLKSKDLFLLKLHYVYNVDKCITVSFNLFSLVNWETFLL